MTMTWKEWDPAVIEQLKEFMANQIPFNRVLGIVVDDLSEGFCRLKIPFRPELIGDPFRPALHGGVLSSLVDTCGGASVFTVIALGDRVSTIDMLVDYLRPGELRDIVCEAKVTRIGNRVASTEMKVFHPDAPDQLIATGRGVYNVKRG
jgi:uncharacterized protein (TIGR00369 family)